ncbi:reverse transcriptase domain-containing protein [Tanacetum coccineum]|uniref:Reverse transcriptase domain-containing protein n=1 Tax=Tanacetum coccineum TaxID=301880 RepID=A0ABQ5C8U4_9ASTR
MGMNFTHLVATSDEGRNKSSIKFLMTLTLNSPSPDKSQVHLSLEDERTTEFIIEERSSHCCRSAPSRTSRRKEAETEEAKRAQVFDYVLLGMLQVHAYGRSHGVYNYILDPCSPMHITIGDGVKRENMVVEHAESTTLDSFKGGFCAYNFTSGQQKVDSAGIGNLNTMHIEKVDSDMRHSRETEFAFEKHHNKRTSSRRVEALSESEGSAGGHWKSKPNRKKSGIEDDLSQPWVFEKKYHFTPRIRYFDFPKTRMPSHIKTYDESEDLEDHLKIFQAAAKTERWAMPTWCHMFNSTLTGNVRVWFDDLPQESIDSYDDLKKAFLENYL